MFVSERLACGHSVCVSTGCWREERGESTTTTVSAENEYWYHLKIFSIKLFEKNLFF